jgi:hypothetical protein
MEIRWPKNFISASLKAIRIRGFSGESELVQLLLFLLRNFLLRNSPVLKTLRIDTDKVFMLRCVLEERYKCNVGREVAQTHLAPNVPSTVKLSIM